MNFSFNVSNIRARKEKIKPEKRGPDAILKLESVNSIVLSI